MSVTLPENFCGINVATQVEERHSNNPAFSKEIIVKVFAVASLILLNIITLGIPIVVYAIYKIGTRLANASWKKDNSTAIQNQAVESVNSTKSTNNENEFQSLLKEIKNAKSADSLQNSIDKAFKEIKKKNEEIEKKNEEIAKAAFENKEWKNLGIEQKIALVNKLKEEEKDHYLKTLLNATSDSDEKFEFIKCFSDKKIKDQFLEDFIKNDQVQLSRKFSALSLFSEEKKPAEKDKLIEIYIGKEIEVNWAENMEYINNAWSISRILRAYAQHSDSKKLGEDIQRVVEKYLNAMKEGDRNITPYMFNLLMNYIGGLENDEIKDELLNEIIEISKINQKIQAANQLTKNKIKKLEAIIVAVGNNDDILKCINSLENISLSKEKKDDLFNIITVVCLDKNVFDWDIKRFDCAIKSVVNIENIELKDSLLESIIDSAGKNNRFIEMEGALYLLSKEEHRQAIAIRILDTALREENFHAVIFVKKFLPEKFKEVAFLKALTEKADKCNDSLILFQIKNCIEQLDDNDKKQELLNEIDRIIKEREVAVPLFSN